MSEYEILRFIWWLLLGVLFGGYAVTDGFDLGVAVLSPFVARGDMEKRILLNTIGPVWEGNQVWIILGAGAIFAAWPTIYAVAFSGFYFALLLVLAGFILRPVAFKYRSKVENKRWRAMWDGAFFIGGFLPALIFGVAMGNVLQGVPFHFDPMLRDFYTGTFFQLLNPFALICGLVSLSLLTAHGGFYLSTKTTGKLKTRAMRSATISSCLFIVMFAVAGFWLAHNIEGYALVKAMAHDAPSNPLYKSVIREGGAWLANYDRYPWMVFAPLIGFAGVIFAITLAHLWRGKLSVFCSGLSLIGVVATFGLSMYPFILPSSSNPSQSLMIWDSSSSQTTLLIMLIATAIFMPIILLYTSWVYRVMRGPVTEETIEEDQEHSLY